MLSPIDMANRLSIDRQYHGDLLGTTEGLSDGTQSLVARYDMSAWGVVNSGSVTDQSYVFVGGQGYWYEPALALHYVQARWLNPATGSWLSPDPEQTEPRYRYAANLPTLRVDPSGRQSLPASFGTRARDAVGEYARLLKAERRKMRLAMLRRQQAEFEQDNPRMTGIGAWVFGAVTGIAQPREDDFAEFSVAFQDGINNPPGWLRWVNEGSHRQLENTFRSGLRAGHHYRLFQLLTLNPRPQAVALWNAQRARAQRSHFAFLIPPLPATDAYIDWMAGFSFGIVDSLITTFLFLPFNLAQSILGICQLAANTDTIWPALVEHVQKYFHDLDKANHEDEFGKGKATGRLLFDLIMAWLLVKDVARHASDAARSISQRGFSGAVGHELGKGWGYNAGVERPAGGGAARSAVFREAAAMGEEAKASLDRMGVEPDQVRARTKQSLAEDAQQGSGIEPEATEVRPPNRATVTIEYKQGWDLRDFKRKVRALQDLAERGKLRKAPNPVRRDRSIGQQYKNRLIRRAYDQFAHIDPAKYERLRARITTLQADHLQDLQLSGLDDSSNLWLLDEHVNIEMGRDQIWPQIKDLPDGTVINRIIVKGLP